MKILFRVSILALVLAASVFAQTPRDSVRTYYFDPVVVTGTNTDVLRSALPNSISVVDRRQIEESGETSVLSILNRRVPGMFVTERGVLGYGSSDASAGTINIRGVGGSPNTDVLVLTDGRPQMMGLFGHPFPDTYVSSNVERVEVIRGPASLVHGTNAMGGVINIITRQDRMPGLQVDAGASHGSFATEKAEGGASYGFGDGSVSVSGDHYQTDGHRPNSQFRMNNGSAKVQDAVTDHLFFSADAGISGYTAFDPGPVNAPVNNHWVDITRGTTGMSLENRSETMQGAVKIFYNYGINDIYDGFHSTDKNIGAVLYQGVKLGTATQLTAGVDYNHYGGAAENRTAVVSFGEHFIDESGVYLLVQQGFFDRATLNAGLRFNHHSLYGTESIPQLGLALRLDSSFTLRAAAGKGFRSPTIRELYLFPAPTPTLQPERMWNYELGLLWQQTGLGSAEFTAFVADGSNIIRVGGMFPNLVLSNSGSFIHRGIEVSGTVQISGRVSGDLTYGYLDPGDQTMGSPRHKLYLGGSYDWSTVRWNVGIQHVEKLYGADFGQELLPSYTIVNSRLTWTFVRGVSLYISGENLFDTGYTIIYGYPMPGRTMIGGISLHR